MVMDLSERERKEAVELVEKFIVLGNKAKNFGRYEVANACWCFVSDLVERYGLLNNRVQAVLETQSPGKYSPTNEYYSLAVWEVNGRELNVPIPLLAQKTVAAFCMVATVRERGEHNREVREANDEDIISLKCSLFALYKEVQKYTQVPRLVCYNLNLDVFEGEAVMQLLDELERIERRIEELLR